MTPDELEERQERLARAILEIGRVVGETAAHGGYSPAKKLEGRLLAILDGQDVDEPQPSGMSAIASGETVADEETDDGEAEDR